jgi:NADH-quinone oxidoreductase subunit H
MHLIASAEGVVFQDSLLWMVLRVGIVLGFILAIVPGIIWWERRLLSWMQDRIGPNRVGDFHLFGRKIHLFGLLQPIADGIKLFFKEDIVPDKVDKFIHFIAPMIALFPAFAIWGTLPWGPDTRLTPIADVDIGILYILAISSMGVYGVFLAGWASNNKYSLMGGLRSAAQLISYELAMGVSLGCIILATGSLRLTEVVARQHEPLYGAIPWLQNWFILTPFGFVAGIIFLICMVAETNRAPFDLPEAESELIAGFHTEYSSMKFAVFFMGEYASMMAFCGVFAVMFLGGWSPLPLNWAYLAEHAPAFLASVCRFVSSPLAAPLWFIGKLVLGLTFYIWLRATLPRLRYDQLMNLGWKYLLPLAALNFVVVAIWMQFGWPAMIGAVVVLTLLYFLVVVAFIRPRSAGEDRSVMLVR